MNYSALGNDMGKLVLRLTLGMLIALHGVAKLQNLQAATAGIAKQVVALGLPEFVAYGVYVGEVVAPILLILGIFSRVGGFIVVVNMVFAVVLVHTQQLFLLSKTGGWQLELQAFYLFCGLVVALIGSGRYAVRPD
jgi:putative oxidoreductase